MLLHGAGLTKLSNKGNCFGWCSQEKEEVKGMSPQGTSQKESSKAEVKGGEAEMAACKS